MSDLKATIAALRLEIDALKAELAENTCTCSPAFKRVRRYYKAEEENSETDQGTETRREEDGGHT